ncbi:hypothetical protein Bbelb_110700 [Branchiostoma belcheri]|nr:hypothetical protein Bbelb_110700 [Branchiostoma belcheri]
MGVNLTTSLNIKIDDATVKNTGSFTYLGSTITADGHSHTEILSRLGKASSAFSRIQKVLKNGMLSLQNKLRIYQATVISILLYGSETWQIYAADQKRLNAFHTRCLRKILNISYLDRITNKEVYQRTNQTEVASMIRKRRFRWFGHVMRMGDNRMAKKILDWKPCGGKRSRGRPRLTWKADVEKDLEAVGSSWYRATTQAQQRTRWKRTARCAIK